MRAKLRRDLNLLVLKLRPSKASSFLPICSHRLKTNEREREQVDVILGLNGVYKRKEEKTRCVVRGLLSNEVFL